MTDSSRQRVAVLVSGSGSNLQALLDAAREPGFPAEIALVVANVPGIYALDRAHRAGVPTLLLEHRQFPSRSAFDAALVELLQPYRIDWICLAGFMRLLGPGFLEAYRGRVLNIHPSLLPSFPGLHAQRQALAAGVKISGCTVHRVDEGTDTGPILAQAAVPVLASDDEATLTQRILQEEHRLYPSALRRAIEGSQVEQPSVVAALHNPPLN